MYLHMHIDAYVHICDSGLDSIVLVSQCLSSAAGSTKRGRKLLGALWHYRVLLAETTCPSPEGIPALFEGHPAYIVLVWTLNFWNHPPRHCLTLLNNGLLERLPDTLESHFPQRQAAEAKITEESPVEAWLRWCKVNLMRKQTMPQRLKGNSQELLPSEKN